MNKRDDKLVVYVDEEDAPVLSEWKRMCLGKYGNGGIKKRVSEIIKEDLKRLKSLK